jgi:hypothetical protein
LEEFLDELDLANIENHCIFSDLDDEEEDPNADIDPHFENLNVLVPMASDFPASDTV